MRVPVGRQAECDAIAGFLAAATAAPALLTITGEAGLGKTTLCRHAVDRARQAGFVVLECRPTQSEAQYGYVGLTDLIGYVDDATLDALPTPQRDALAVATLRSAPHADPPDERAIATATSTLLQRLSETAPLLVVVDDVGWLDGPSHAALEFALRRVRESRLALLTCERSGEPHRDGLAVALEQTASSQELSLGGLDASALFRVIKDELGLSLARPVVSRIAEVCAGNPLLALEVARQFAHDGGAAPADVRMPSSIRQPHADRLGRLSARAREALLAVASMARPSATVIDDLGLGRGLREAEEAGIVRVDTSRIDFAHPLVASTTLELASVADRRAMHGRLGQVASETETRARHLALAAAAPDEGLAEALDEAVESAVARAALADASEFARLALDRTEEPASPIGWQRRVRLAELVYATGATAEAAELLSRLAEACPPGPVRARGSLLMLEIAFQTSSAERAREFARAALADADGDAALKAKALLCLATLSFGADDDGARYAEEAHRTLVENGVADNPLLAWAGCEQVSARFHRGHGLDRQGLERALELERTGRTWRSSDQVATIRAAFLKSADFTDESLAAFDELRQRADEEGNDGLVPYIAGHTSGLFLRQGRIDAAAAAAAEHLACAEATGQRGQRAQALFTIAMVRAHHGELDDAEVAAREALSHAESAEDPWMEMSSAAALGFIELSRDHPKPARDWLDRWHLTMQTLGLRDPGISRFHADHIEALVACGDLDLARQRTTELESLAADAFRVSAAATAARCRGLLASASGDPDQARQWLDEALSLHEKCLVPFEQARTLLVLGIVQRRARSKRDAAATLTRATEAFGALKASAWRDRAAAELGRVASVARRSDELTATERRVCELAASGLTNKQVAEQAFISPKTVEANLARAYRKLGITSRAQLGATMAGRAGTAAEVAAPQPDDTRSGS
jgi:DNA-binding CsgD family transcriptional regulator